MNQYQWRCLYSWCISSLIFFSMFSFYLKLRSLNFQQSPLSLTLPFWIFTSLFIIYVPCCSRQASCCLTWQATLLHPKVSTNSASKTTLSRPVSKRLTWRSSPGKNKIFWFWKVSDLSRPVLAEASIWEMTHLRLAWREGWFFLMFLHTRASLLAF